jgi:hypothetical protein
LRSLQRATGITAVVTIVALIAAACVSGAGGASGDGAAAAGGDDTIAFAAPLDGSTVSIPFAVAIDSSVTLADPESGEHHAHIYFDTGTDSNDYDIVYGNTWQVTRQLSPGAHQLTVALANPDHSLAGPTQTIDVTVGDGGDAPAAPAAPTVGIPGY